MPLRNVWEWLEHCRTSHTPSALFYELYGYTYVLLPVVSHVIPIWLIALNFKHYLPALLANEKAQSPE